jgi:hypothetical protein
MSDAVAIDLFDAPIVVENRGHGRPCRSKNKVKIPAAVSTSSTPVKHRRGRPLGSKNKNLPLWQLLLPTLWMQG